MPSDIPYEPLGKRALLPPGPWETEQNLYTFEAFGLKCAVMRMPHNGCLNGYVKADVFTTDFNVHGGITYHEDGWLGFDTFHAWDLRPATAQPWPDLVYRDADYVIAETKRLAQQVRDHLDTLIFAFNYEATPC